MNGKEIDARHLTVLRAFVYRARRVEAHSLTTDKERLAGWASARMSLEFTGSSAALVQSLPPEDLLESLAARVRPMLLQRESTNATRVLAALKNFGSGDLEILNAIQGLKPLWRRLRPENKELLAWSAQVKVAPDSAVETITDLRLAYAWLYGDVVHGDQARLAEAKSFGLDERFRAAVLVVTNAAQLTVWTLNTLRNMHARGLIEIDQSYFDEAVVVLEQEYKREVGVSIGTTGSIPPGFGEPYGPGWTTLAQPPTP